MGHSVHLVFQQARLLASAASLGNENNGQCITWLPLSFSLPSSYAASVYLSPGNLEYLLDTSSSPILSSAFFSLSNLMFFPVNVLRAPGVLCLQLGHLSSFPPHSPFFLLPCCCAITAPSLPKPSFLPVSHLLLPALPLPSPHHPYLLLPRNHGICPEDLKLTKLVLFA